MSIDVLAPGLLTTAQAQAREGFRQLGVGCGGALGLVGLYTMADFPAHDALNAAAIGIVSGLAATGSHELIKQITGGGVDADN